MIIYILVALDYILFNVTFSYQRVTLSIARQNGVGAGAPTHIVQATLTSSFIGFLGWFSWVTLIVACVALWQISWLSIGIYLAIRFILTSVTSMPLQPLWAPYISKRASRIANSDMNNTR